MAGGGRVHMSLTSYELLDHRLNFLRVKSFKVFQIFHHDIIFTPFSMLIDVCYFSLLVEPLRLKSMIFFFQISQNSSKLN